MFSGLPLHPIMVHMPMALVILLPVITLIAFFVFKKSENITGKKMMVYVGIFHLFLTISTFISLETGEAEEDRVERVVAERYIEIHEHKAEAFMSATSIALVAVFIAAFLFADKFFTPTMIMVMLMQGVLIYLGYQVGHSGGELVYIHNSASVHSEMAKTQVLDQKRVPTHKEEDDDDDD